MKLKRQGIKIEKKTFRHYGINNFNCHCHNISLSSVKCQINQNAWSRDCLQNALFLINDEINTS